MWPWYPGYTAIRPIVTVSERMSLNTCPSLPNNILNMPTLKDFDVTPIAGAEYAVAIKNRFNRTWVVEKFSNYREAQQKFNAAFDFPKIGWSDICLLEKVAGEKKIIKVLHLDAS
jgi:hypothetical protein